jgi:hypothetical protein
MKDFELGCADADLYGRKFLENTFIENGSIDVLTQWE